MLDFFGSQFGIIIFVVIGVGAYWLLKTISGDKSKGDDESAKGCIIISGGIGIVVSIVCFVLSQCQHASDY